MGLIFSLNFSMSFIDSLQTLQCTDGGPTSLSILLESLILLIVDLAVISNHVK